MQFKDYYQIRDWVEGFIPLVWGKEELGLVRIEYLLKLLGNPQNKFKSIHIAGTSGKGSTCFYIAQLLRNCKLETRNSKLETNYNFQNSKVQKVSDFGFRNSNFTQPKVGLHVSPHLVDIRERMQIFSSPVIPAQAGIQKSDENWIPDQVRNDKSAATQNDNLMSMKRFVRLFSEIKPVVEKIKKTKVELTPSYFEILVAASFKYFAEEKVDWAVVEAGLGGRLDATNVLKPEISVITNVGLDHTEILGKTIEKIAWEKAGIIKEGVPAITGATGKALKIIEKVAREKNAPLIKLSAQKVPNILLKLPNPPSSFLAISTLKTLGLGVDKDSAKKVLRDTFPGRLEQVDDNVILDGAHNQDKIKFLISWIKKMHLANDPVSKNLHETGSSVKSIILVTAFKKEKNWKRMVDLLVKNLPIKKVIATQFYAVTDMGPTPSGKAGLRGVKKHQSVDPIKIAQYVGSIRQGESLTSVYSNSQKAVFSSLDARRYHHNSLLLVTGSLYLVGEVRTMWYLPEF